MSEKYWAVWRENGGGGPNKKHVTKEGAIKEAARLAQNTRDRIFVLEVIGVVAPVDLPIEFLEVN